MVPWLGFSCPVISFMNVDLPAPFGPSRPVMPGGIAHGHVVEAADLSVPLGHALGVHERGPDRQPFARLRRNWHHVTISTPRTRRMRMRIEPAMSTTTVSAAKAGANW